MKASLNHLRMRFSRLMAVLLCTLLLGGCSQLCPIPCVPPSPPWCLAWTPCSPTRSRAEAATSLREVTLYFRLRGSALPCPGKHVP